jgi:hypothetical protein
MNALVSLATIYNRNAVRCEFCDVEFAPKRRAPQTRFCCPAHRQAAFRRKPLSPTAQATLLLRQAEDVVRRGMRRSERFKELNRDRSIAFDPVYSGPSRDDVPELDSFRLPSRRELRAKVAAEQ